MSHTYPIRQERERALNETIFKYINRLGCFERLHEKETDQNQFQKSLVNLEKAESHFKKNLKTLAKCQSFKTGTEKEEYATVLHKAITMFKLKKSKTCEPEKFTQIRVHESPEVCTLACAQRCAQERVLKYIMTTYPMLLYCPRNHDPYICGQTPLHMAIAQENKQLVEMLLAAAENDRSHAGGVKDLLSQNATGLKFKSNVMMGQLPLSIAVLTDNHDIVKLLLDRSETEVCQQNSLRDNLCHSLLKYVYIFPEKEDTAVKMMKFINDERKDCCKEMFSMENENKETPLILATKYGQVEIVKYIIDEGYSFSDDSSGLFDVKLYDMTEIDHQLKEYRRQEDDRKMKEDLTRKSIKPPPIEKVIDGPSMFELIFHHSYKTSLKFMQIRPINWMIRNKWRHYRYFLYSFLLFHVMVMSVLTASAVERVKSNRTLTINQGLRAPFPAYFAIIMTIVSLLYIWLGIYKIVQTCRRQFQLTLKLFLNPYANAIFHALFLLFALCIISDFAATWSSDYNNMLLIAAVVIGWYLLLFFLRANSFFCFFTSLIQRILLQDITRFAPIIALQLVAFSTAMFMLLHNPNSQNSDGYSTWGEMLLLTFKSFLGVGDIPISDSSHPVWLAIVYVIFIIMTTILMLNALIAILSSTCTDLLSQFTPDMHLLLQQLAVILFFEGLLPNMLTHYFANKVAKGDIIHIYDRLTKDIIPKKRHLMKIDVLDDEDGIGAETEANIVHKIAKVAYEKLIRHDTNPQSIQKGHPTGMNILQQSTRSNKSTMTNMVGHFDSETHIDIYHHPQFEQTQTS